MTRARRDRPAIFVSCEHGGNAIPRRYRALFAGQRAALAGHRGYDAGALEMARQLAAAFGAPLVASTVSRLLVDLNRSIGHPRLFSDVTRAAPAAVRREILERHYAPHRAAVERLVARAIGRGRRVVHLCAHSFSARLDGRRRDADVGLLYDPSRPGEAALCAAWLRELRALAPGLRVRRNYPYRGASDGFTTALRRRHADARYLGVELELNQSTMIGPMTRERRRAVVDALARALDALTGPQR